MGLKISGEIQTRDSKLSPLVEIGLKISGEIQTRDSKLSPLVEMGLKISCEIQTKDSKLSPLVEMGLKKSRQGTQCWVHCLKWVLRFLVKSRQAVDPDGVNRTEK